MICDVRSLRNASLPIMRLPTEILTLIFAMTRVPHCEEPGETGARWHLPVSDRAFYSMPLVCRRWYDIIVYCPTLWTSVFVTQCVPDLANARLSLLRSQPCVNLTAEICTWKDDPSVADVTTAALAEIPRMTELSLLGDTSEDDMALIMNTPAPHLQTFVLDGHTGSHITSLFGGHCPSLRYLAVSMATVAPSSAWRELRQLHLSLQRYDSAEAVASLLGALAASPALEDVMFSNVSCWKLDDPDPARHTIHMPGLRRLAFDNVQYSAVGNILSYLRAPAGVSLSCRAAPAPLFPYQELGALRLPNTLHIDDLTHLRAVRLDFDAAGHKCTLYGLGVRSALVVTECAVDTEQSLRGFAKSVALLLHHTEELWLCGTEPVAACDASFGARVLQHLLTSAPKLARLYMAVSTLSTLGDAAFDWPCVLGKELLCPQLAEFHLQTLPTSPTSLLQVLAARDRNPIALTKVYVTSPEETELYPPALLDLWRVAARSSQDRAQGLELIETEDFPQMAELPACRAQSSGRWKWPVWPEYNATHGTAENRVGEKVAEPTRHDSTSFAGFTQF